MKTILDIIDTAMIVIVQSYVGGTIIGTMIVAFKKEWNKYKHNKREI